MTPAHHTPPAYLAARRAALYEPPSGLALPERSLGTLDYVHNCDALTLLRALPSNYINCLVTSPPYFGLRDYGVAGQIGLEATPQEFIRRLVDVFREVRRVLRDDGVIFVNMGDSYASGEVGRHDSVEGREIDGKPVTSKATERQQTKLETGLPAKNLLGMPWRLAFALQDDGWILRSDIIWHKPNPMPESVTDRPTKSHEYVFLFAKSERYWYDTDAIREPQTEGSIARCGNGGERKAGPKAENRTGKPTDFSPTGLLETGRNKRTVWTIATEPTPFAHFATFPQKLIEPMILAGCPHKVCAVCGAPWVRQVEVSGGTIGKSWNDDTERLTRGQRATDNRAKGGHGYTRQSLGFAPTCDHNAATRPGIVLDPFMGSGTTGLVARRLGRHFIGSELNADYIKLARQRLDEPFTLPMMDMIA